MNRTSYSTGLDIASSGTNRAAGQQTPTKKYPLLKSFLWLENVLIQYEAALDEFAECCNQLGLTPLQGKTKNRQLVSTYGITLEEFRAILVSQGWLCPLCGKKYQAGKRWCVDHEHRDGLQGPIRGILCMSCNAYKLGNLTLAEIKLMFKYLTSPPAVATLGGERIASPKKKKKYRRKRRT